MAKKSNTNPELPGWYGNARQIMKLSPMNGLMSPTFEKFWETQDKMVGEFEDFARSWYARRHEANQSAMNVAREASKLDGEANIANSIRLMNNWLVKSLEHMSEDARDSYECYARCIGHLSQGSQAAGEEVNQHTADTAESTIKSATKKAK